MPTRKRRLRNPAELILVNPGTPERRVYRKRKSAGGSSKTGRIEKMAVTRRRRRSTTSTTTKRKSPKRVAAGKKAARTRKRNANPAPKRRKRVAAKTAAPKRRRRRNPAKRAAAPKRRRVAAKRTSAPKRRRRRNPSAAQKKSDSLMGSIAAAPRTEAARSAAESARRSAAAKKGWATKRRNEKSTKPKKSTKATTRKATSGKRKPMARRKYKNYRTLTRQGRKAGRGVRTLSSARNSILRQKRHGRPAAQKYLRAHGMTNVNPSLKMLVQDMKALLPTIGAGLSAMVGGLYLGKMVNEQVLGKWTGAPAFVKKHSAPIATAIAAVGLWAAAKTLFKGKLSKFSVPILVGGMAAAAAHFILSKTELAGKLGLSPGSSPAAKSAAAATAAVVDAKVDAGQLDGLGDYSGNGGVFGDYTSMGDYTALGYVPPGGARYQPDGTIGDYAGSGGVFSGLDDEPQYSDYYGDHRAGVGDYTALGTGNEYFGDDDASQFAKGQGIPGFGDYSGNGGIFGGMDDMPQYSDFYEGSLSGKVF